MAVQTPRRPLRWAPHRTCQLRKWRSRAKQWSTCPGSVLLLLVRPQASTADGSSWPTTPHPESTPVLLLSVPPWPTSAPRHLDCTRRLCEPVGGIGLRSWSTPLSARWIDHSLQNLDSHASSGPLEDCCGRAETALVRARRKGLAWADSWILSEGPGQRDRPPGVRADAGCWTSGLRATGTPTRCPRPQLLAIRKRIKRCRYERAAHSARRSAGSGPVIRL